MTMELDREFVSYQVRVALNKHLAIWKGSGENVADKLSTMLTEAMFDVAATSSLYTPEQGVLKGIHMIRNWED